MSREQIGFSELQMPQVRYGQYQHILRDEVNDTITGKDDSESNYD